MRSPTLRPRLLLLSLVALLLGGLAALGATARSLRPAPFGDAVADSSNPHARGVTADALRVTSSGAVQAYDRRTGQAAWSYRRPGSTPIRLVPLTGDDGDSNDGTTVAVWDDGMLTGLQPGAAAVRWHRFVPGVTAGGPLLVVPLGSEPQQGVPLPPPTTPTGASFLVLTSQLVMTYNTGDGTIRTSTLPPQGCRYRLTGPAAPAQVGDWLVVRRDCADGGVTLEGYDLDGRRWGRPYDAVATSGVGGSALQVTALPWLRSFTVDLVTGRAAQECICAAR
ncbi:hypothetical protein [Streptacidiphilus fuscans]|uniref:Uncharacterized protein n=1 Tax=Streptacidiphilus fuscans TaxID=2789292 RepID=A0A931B6W5_9ACTN|nr:hypothetical protein [Streptacidiphilus fuscans]MBF9071338.1 hypothetical protein [Streptacidiphilus fuscans]